MLFDRRVQVVNKRGGVHRPLGELDLRNERLLINWEHPIRTQMDERSFLRMALSWILAKEAASGDAEQMMELALRCCLSKRTQSMPDNITAKTLLNRYVSPSDCVLLVNPPVEETRYAWLRWNQPLDLLDCCDLPFLTFV